MQQIQEAGTTSKKSVWQEKHQKDLEALGASSEDLFESKLRAPPPQDQPRAAALGSPRGGKQGPPELGISAGGIQEHDQLDGA